MFFTTQNEWLHGVSIHDGEGLPGFPVALPSVFASSPAIGEGHLIVGSFDAHVYSYNPSTGGLQWRTPLSKAVESSPLIANGVVYVSSVKSGRRALRTRRFDRRHSLAGSRAD